MPVIFKAAFFFFLLLLVSAGAYAADKSTSYTLVHTFSLPGATKWDYLTFDAEKHRLFITRGDSVDILDTDSNTIVATIPNLQGVHGVALAPKLGKGFISEGKANRVAVFDLSSFQILATIPTGIKPDAIAYDPKTQRVFTANGGSGSLTAIDAKTDAVINTIDLDGDPEFAVVDGHGHLYINIENKARIAALDTRTLKLVTTYNLAPACDGPTGLAIDIVRKRLFSTCANKNMSVVDLIGGTVLATQPIGAHSDAAVFDLQKNLAFSSNGDGTLTIMRESSPRKYKILQTVTTLPTARTMALDPLTHKIYLAAAETNGIDPATAHTPHPRPLMIPDSFKILIVAPE